MRGLMLPEASTVEECIAIGFTAAGEERWGGAHVEVQCVGIPSYPGRLDPRVVGILRPCGDRDAKLASPAIHPRLSYVRGDATKPRGRGLRVIAHIVNDATPNWGGRGFASAARRAFPEAQEDFQRWVAADRRRLTLGQSHYTSLSDDLGIFHMVAQRAYGPSAKPRIRYAALDKCLSDLGSFAGAREATLHIPRIGTGEAGGAWDVVRDMILEQVCARGVPVTVYDLPNRKVADAQPQFDFVLRS
ncbi:MAG: hypothetical protein V4550_09155 [Gemmatimonadota bacterium]